MSINFDWSSIIQVIAVNLMGACIMVAILFLLRPLIISQKTTDGYFFLDFLKKQNKKWIALLLSLILLAFTILAIPHFLLGAFFFAGAIALLFPLFFMIACNK